MKKMEIYRNLLYSLIIALIYIIMDFPVQKTGYLHFAPVIGLKNFLPFVSGLFEPIFSEQLENLGVDNIDYYLLHNFQTVYYDGSGL